MSDYRRPAWYQIRPVGRCDTCGREHEFSPQESVDGRSCYCGGRLESIGESYPSSSEDWDEERDRVDGEWRRR